MACHSKPGGKRSARPSLFELRRAFFAAETAKNGGRGGGGSRIHRLLENQALQRQHPASMCRFGVTAQVLGDFYKRKFSDGAIQTAATPRKNPSAKSIIALLCRKDFSWCWNSLKDWP